MNKKTFVTHISYFWWLYILTAVVFSVGWVFAIDFALEPESNEKLEIYSFGDNIDISGLENGIKQVLPDITDSNIEYVGVGNVKNDLYDPSMLNSLLYARGQDSDFMIVENSAITESSFAPAYFNIIDKQKMTAALGNIEFYEEEYDGKTYAYGILLGGKDSGNNFSAFYDGDGECYLMFCFKCDNLGGLVGDGKQTDDAALAVIKWLLAEGGEHV